MKGKTPSPTITLPVGLTLTDEGEYFFNKHHKTLSVMQSRKDSRGTRIVLDTYSAKTLQRLVSAGYIAEIAVTRSDFSSKRNEIMDLAKLTVYAVLWREHTKKLGPVLRKTPTVVRWNRANPKNALNNKNLLINLRSPEQQRGLDGFSTVREQVLEEIFRAVSGGAAESQEEYRLNRLKVDNFLQQLNPLIWALLAREQEQEAYEETVATLGTAVQAYLSQTAIADYLSLLLLELTSLGEKSLMESAVTRYLQGKVDTDSFLKDPSNRSKILTVLEQNNCANTLLWKLKLNRTDDADSYPFQILLFTQDMDPESISRDIERMKGLDIKGKTLSDFCNDKGEEEDPSTSLGLLYLTYLQEECHRSNTYFTSFVNSLDSRISYITLNIRF